MSRETSRSVQISTPEAIREGIDSRRSSGHQTIARRKRPVTVVVSGERGSGKTTLIAILAHALENSGHAVQKEPHIPRASAAIADLHDQFDVVLVEDETNHIAGAPSTNWEAECARIVAVDEKLRAEVVSLTAAKDAALRMLRDEQKAGDDARAEITNLKAENEVFGLEIDQLTHDNARLRKIRPDIGALEEQIGIAFAEVREAAILDMDRRRVRRIADERMAESVKLRNEADARFAKAQQRMRLALMGTPLPSPVAREDVELMRAYIPASDPCDADAREASATAKLRAANLVLMSEDHGEGC